MSISNLIGGVAIVGVNVVVAPRASSVAPSIASF